MKGLTIYALYLASFWACLALFAIVGAAGHACHMLARDRRAKRWAREQEAVSIHGGHND